MKIEAGNTKLKTLGKREKTFLVFLVFIILSWNLSGCACVKEAARGFAGISTKALEEARKNAQVKTFRQDYFSCYTKVLDILQQIGSHVYSQNIKKHMIAIYVSGEDTTAVGIFFKEIDKNSTQVEVSSPSTFAKEMISLKVFSALESPAKSAR